MTKDRRVGLSSDAAAILVMQVIAGHTAALGWEVVGIGPVTPESTH